MNDSEETLEITTTDPSFIDGAKQEDGAKQDDGIKHDDDMDVGVTRKKTYGNLISSALMSANKCSTIIVPKTQQISNRSMNTDVDVNLLDIILELRRDVNNLSKTVSNDENIKEDIKKLKEENKNLKEENKKLKEDASNNENDTTISKRIAGLELFQGYANKQLEIINQNNLINLYSTVKAEIELFMLNFENDNPNPKVINDDIQTINLDDATLCTSFDADRVAKKRGKLIMVFSNYKKRIQDAEKGINRFWYSKTFLTQKGYKICARIYPNGDGNGNVGKYLSFYFMIVKTSEDDKLDWPFKHKVELKLLNQTGIKSDISDGVFPDDDRFYQKPVEITNTGIGCPKFVPQVVFHEKYGYLVNDQIILSISVNDNIEYK